MQLALFTDDSPLAVRQPKTDRLILARFLKDAGEDQKLVDADIDPAYAILVRWADFEKSGRLAELTETQLQGDFLREVFGDALGYARAVENQPVWHLEQHFSILGQTPDAVLGRFEQGKPKTPLAIVELKGSDVHLDRDRRNGRTPVDQCWDYLVDTEPDCRWGIVSNIISIRLYERNSTKRVYEHFTLQSLRDKRTFRQFYALFHRKGLIEWTAGVAPTADRLLEKTRSRQREVGDRLYEDYSENRTNLIRFLHFDLQHPVEESIEMAQRLFDRVMFIAFCEDRSLLPEQTIPKAMKVSGFHEATNPKWKNFKNLFTFINHGSERNDIPKYNGGLFADHDVDELDLPDEPWTNFFHSISTYDFADEVNLDVLGHLFERSITELEKLKVGGLFGDAEKAERYATMPQSVKRKQLGIYYTPRELTSLIVQYTVGELIDERFAALAEKFGISKKDAARRIMPDDEKFWRGCLDILRNLKIVDPACGSGAFLFQAYNVLEHRYLEVIGHLDKAEAADADELADEVPLFILNENLYGVDLSPEAVEITQLALWIRSATPGQTLATLSRNIVHGNSLVHDQSHHPDGFDWRDRFPDVFPPPR
ncbi:MAG: DNA methyltransferase, partial [Pirellulales bacterium]